MQFAPRGDPWNPKDTSDVRGGLSSPLHVPEQHHGGHQDQLGFASSAHRSNPSAMYGSDKVDHDLRYDRAFLGSV